MRTICLCGSTRFADHFARLTKELSLRGHVVYTIAMAKEDGEGMTAEQKLVLDAVHMGKIANSDIVHFINIDGYMGESTRREYYFARVMGKQVSFEDLSKVPEDIEAFMADQRRTRDEQFFAETWEAIEEVKNSIVETVSLGVTTILKAKEEVTISFKEKP